MLAYKELQDILDRSIGWEREFNDLLDVAEYGLKNEKSKGVVSSLRKRQGEILEVLNNINVADFGPSGWVRFSGDLKRDELIPKKRLNRNSSPEEIVAYVREYEDALKLFYQRVADKIRSEAHKELFLSLVRLKESQIERLASL